jgi:hypothetical protein
VEAGIVDSFGVAAVKLLSIHRRPSSAALDEDDTASCRPERLSRREACGPPADDAYVRDISHDALFSTLGD